MKIKCQKGLNLTPTNNWIEFVKAIARVFFNAVPGPRRILLAGQRLKPLVWGSIKLSNRINFKPNDRVAGQIGGQFRKPASDNMVLTSSRHMLGVTAALQTCVGERVLDGRLCIAQEDGLGSVLSQIQKPDTFIVSLFDLCNEVPDKILGIRVRYSLFQPALALLNEGSKKKFTQPRYKLRNTYMLHLWGRISIYWTRM